MNEILLRWRFYSLSEAEYAQCMQKSFFGNLLSISALNIIVASLAACFSAFPIVVEQRPDKAAVYLLAAAAAFFMNLFARGMHRRGNTVNRYAIYVLTALYYANLMFFAIYLGVWSSPDKLAVTYMGILIVALVVLINPPALNLCLTLASFCVFSVSTSLIKTGQNATFDITNAALAAAVSLIFGWWVTKLRLALLSNEHKLTIERNSYYDQSTVDELTRLKNRRDFTRTFERYLTSSRSSDEWLCIAIMDIDYFKKYNDFYGHPKGDEVLKAIGGALIELSDSRGIYAARVGGEEFALLWFDESADKAAATSNEIAACVRGLGIPHEKSEFGIVTLSIGVHVAPIGVPGDAEALYRAADTALYRAKTQGRNRAVVISFI